MALPTRSVALVLASIASPAFAQFSPPTSAAEGWDRGVTEHSLYAEWDLFSSPFGGNVPDVGSFVGGALSEEARPFDVFDTNPSSGSFIPGSGNIYSFTGVVQPQIDFPGFGLGDGYTTTIILQFRVLGLEVDTETLFLNGDIPPVELVELFRENIDGGFGGALVDFRARFEVDGNADGYSINFSAAETSMSLDIVVVDSFAAPAGCNPADIAEPRGILDLGDIGLFVTSFSAGESAADLDGNEIFDLGDIGLFVNAFSGGCP